MRDETSFIPKMGLVYDAVSAMGMICPHKATATDVRGNKLKTTTNQSACHKGCLTFPEQLKKSCEWVSGWLVSPQRWSAPRLTDLKNMPQTRVEIRSEPYPGCLRHSALTTELWHHQEKPDIEVDCFNNNDFSNNNNQAWQTQFTGKHELIWVV